MTCFAFDPDGRILVTGDSGGVVRTWDQATGQPRAIFPVNVGFPSDLGFYPDARTVAVVAQNEDTIRFWRYESGPPNPEVLKHPGVPSSDEMQGRTKEVWALAFDPDGNLRAAGDDGKVRDWSPGGPRGRVVEDHTNLVRAIAWSPDGSAFASCDDHGQIHIARGKAREAHQALENPRTCALAWSRDGRFLVAGGRDRHLWVLDTASPGAAPLQIETPHQDTYAVAFSPDGRTLALGSHDDTLSLWDVPSFTPRSTLEAGRAITCLAYAPDGSLLVAGDGEGGLLFWEADALELDRPPTRIDRASEAGGLWALAFSPDGQTLATGGDDGVVRLWDPTLREERAALAGHKQEVHAIAFSPDGRTLASGDFAGQIRIWRAGPADAR